MSLCLKAGGRSFVTGVSHQPYDSLRELIEALCALLEGRGPVVVRWNREPEEFDFVFRPEGEAVALEVVRFADHRRAAGAQVFAARVTRDALCRAFWRELRELRRRGSTDEFESNWRRAFPDEDLRRLTKALRGRRRVERQPSP